MLCYMSDLLRDAQQNRYAVGAFNAISLDQINSVISCAEDLDAPIIVQIAEAHMPFIQLEQLVDFLYYRIAKSPINIALHLDHGENFSTILRCINKRFSSVMFDGSALDYEDNIAATRKVVAVCEQIGITVEAELGHVGSEGMDEGDGAVANEKYFTDPDKVADFISRTGISALAIAFGNVHGKYKGSPNLNWSLLRRIAAVAEVPLVLHGGSGISPDDFRQAIALGICKINFFSNVEAEIVAVMKKKDVYPHVLATKTLECDAAIRAVIGSHINIFGSVGRCRPKNLVTP